eukprot:m.76092 g.76092  ORF g.76092 m.76092 type:complete len:346 (+) comp14503_c0_seq3:2245-3282(+)
MLGLCAGPVRVLFSINWFGKEIVDCLMILLIVCALLLLVSRWQWALSRPPPGNTERRAVPVEVDDELDADVMAGLLEQPLPEGFFCFTTGTCPGLEPTHGLEPDRLINTITTVKRITLADKKSLNRQFTDIFEQLLQMTWFKLRNEKPCALCKVRYEVLLPEDEEVVVIMTAAVIGLRSSALQYVSSTDPPEGLLTEDFFPDMRLDAGFGHSLSSSRTGTMAALSATMSSQHPASVVSTTSMDSVPGAFVLRHLGTVTLHLIKETTSLRETGGIGPFVHLFLLEILALARAQVRARGGNALVSQRIRQFILLDNEHKNQGQCLILLSGDAVLVSEQQREIAELTV